MKECKILCFEVEHYRHQLENYSGPYKEKAWEFPEIEKVLEDYLKSGFKVKNMAEYKGDYSFYLERDV